MNVFRLKNVFFLALLSGLLLFSCSKDKDDEPELGKIEHEDEHNFFEYTVSGALKGIKIGKPSWVLLLGNLSTLTFYGDSKDPNRHQLDIDGNFKYDNDEERTGHLVGFPIVDIDGRWTATVGTFPIRNERIKHDNSQISFRVTLKDQQSGRVFGVDDEKLNGEISITEAGSRYYAGTFEFVAYEKDGAASSSITVKGKFRQKL